MPLRAGCPRVLVLAGQLRFGFQQGGSVVELRADRGGLGLQAVGEVVHQVDTYRAHDGLVRTKPAGHGGGRGDGPDQP